VGPSGQPLDSALLAITYISALPSQLQPQIRDLVLDSKTERNLATRVGLPTTRLVFRVATVIMALLCLATLLSDTLPLFLYPLVLIALPTAVDRWYTTPTRPRSKRLVYLSMTAALLYTTALLVFI
jgi:1,4-dihydroxy-2-naphthoate octaprenyltransferase